MKLLKGFKKVFLKKEETGNIKILIDKNDLKFYDEKADNWYLEDNYTFFVGDNCENAEKLQVSLTFR